MIMVEKDKLQHSMAGVVAAQAAFLPSLLLGWSTAIAFVVSLAFAMALMAAKELVWDKALKKGVPSFRDFAAGAIGVAYGAIVLAVACWCKT